MMKYVEKKLTDVFKTIEEAMNPNETRVFHLCLMEPVDNIICILKKIFGTV